MNTVIDVVVVVVIIILIGLFMAVKIVKQYEQGVLFRLGRVLGARQPGLRVNVYSAIDQIAQTTLRKVVGQHTLDQTLSETDKINLDIRAILDVTTIEWGVQVTLVELKDIQLPDSMKRAMARQAEAEREKRAKIINAEGESMAAAALGDASDIMMQHPLALQLRNLQSLVEIGVDKNTTVVFPAPLMTTIAELGSFLARETAAATAPATPQAVSSGSRGAVPVANGAVTK
jgi:regulator of protease activity HflC (stomatin/prohibitin superfamily)